MGPVAKVSTQFQSSSKSRNWAVAPQDLSSVFVIEKQPGAPVSAPVVPPSAADSSLPTGSDSGERSACLLDYIAASSLPCFAAALTRRPVNAVVFSLSWGNIFALNLIQQLDLILLFGSQLFFLYLESYYWRTHAVKLNPSGIFFTSEIIMRWPWLLSLHLAQSQVPRSSSSVTSGQILLEGAFLVGALCTPSVNGLSV